MDEEKETEERKRNKLYEYIPHPLKLVSVFIFLIWLAGIIHYWPQWVDMVFGGWYSSGSMMTAIIGVMLVLIFVLLGLMALTFFLAGNPLSVWIKARIKNKPIAVEIGLDNQLRFRIPRNVENIKWDIDDNTDIQPRREAMVTLPHRIPGMLYISELGTGFGASDVLRNQKVSPKGTIMKLQNKASEMVGWEKRSEYDKQTSNILPWMQWFMVFIFVVLIAAGIAWKMVSNVDMAGSYQKELQKCIMHEGKYALNHTVFITPQPVSTAPPQKSNTGGGIT